MFSSEFMNLAIDIAKKSGPDIPVGCVIERRGEVLAVCCNKKEKLKDVFAHAEVLAIKEASIKIGDWRLLDCNLYVTLEPCPMCTFAILNSHIQNVYFGAYNLNYGACGSKINLLEIYPNNTKIYGGMMEDECQKILDDYFLKIRK